VPARLARRTPVPLAFASRRFILVYSERAAGSVDASPLLERIVDNASTSSSSVETTKPPLWTMKDST
jgi:hypothetical protein